MHDVRVSVAAFETMCVDVRRLKQAFASGMSSLARMRQRDLANIEAAIVGGRLGAAVLQYFAALTRDALSGDSPKATFDDISI